MIGEWELVQFRISLQDGVTQYPESTGLMEISESENNSMSFTSELDYTLLGENFIEVKSGTMELRDKGNYMNVVILDESNTVISTEDHRIMVLTKTDLQLEYADGAGRLRNLTFRKK